MDEFDIKALEMLPRSKPRNQRALASRLRRGKLPIPKKQHVSRAERLAQRQRSWEALPDMAKAFGFPYPTR